MRVRGCQVIGVWGEEHGAVELGAAAATPWPRTPHAAAPVPTPLPPSSRYAVDLLGSLVRHCPNLRSLLARWRMGLEDGLSSRSSWGRRAGADGPAQ